MTPASDGLKWWRDEIDEQRRRRRTANEQYKWNVRLLALSILGGVLWYYWHLEPMLRGFTLLGTPLTVFAAWKLAQSWFPDSWPLSTPSAVSRRILAQPGARTWLITSLVVVVVLLGTTSSLYVEYDEATAAGSYLVTVARGSQLEMRALRINADQTTQGRTYFWNVAAIFRPRVLTLAIEQPEVIFDPLTKSYHASEREVTLRPWSRRRVRVPAGFPVVDYRVIRILPGGRFESLSQRQKAGDPSDFQLQVARSDGSLLVDEPFFFEPYYFNAPRAVIEHHVAREKERKTWREELSSHFEKNTRTERAERMMSRHTACASQTVVAETKLTVRLLKQEAAEPVAEFTVEVMSEGDVQAAGKLIQNIVVK